MFTTKQKHDKSKKHDVKATQEIVIAKPLTDMLIFVSNVPEKLPEKSQSTSKDTSH